MFGIGSTEFLIIAVFALLIFGPDRLPKMGRTIGKWTKEFRRAQDQMQTQIKAEMAGLERATNPFAESDKPSESPEEEAARTVDPEWDEEGEEE